MTTPLMLFSFALGIVTGVSVIILWASSGQRHDR